MELSGEKYRVAWRQQRGSMRAQATESSGMRSSVSLKFPVLFCHEFHAHAGRDSDSLDRFGSAREEGRAAMGEGHNVSGKLRRRMSSASSQRSTQGREVNVLPRHGRAATLNRLVAARSKLLDLRDQCDGELGNNSVTSSGADDAYSEYFTFLDELSLLAVSPALSHDSELAAPLPQKKDPCDEWPRLSFSVWEKVWRLAHELERHLHAAPACSTSNTEAEVAKINGIVSGMQKEFEVMLQQWTVDVSGHGVVEWWTKFSFLCGNKTFVSAANGAATQHHRHAILHILMEAIKHWCRTSSNPLQHSECHFSFPPGASRRCSHSSTAGAVLCVVQAMHTVAALHNEDVESAMLVGDASMQLLSVIPLDLLIPPPVTSGAQGAGVGEPGCKRCREEHGALFCAVTAIIVHVLSVLNSEDIRRFRGFSFSRLLTRMLILHDAYSTLRPTPVESLQGGGEKGDMMSHSTLKIREAIQNFLRSCGVDDSPN